MIDVLMTDGLYEADILPFADVDGQLYGQYSSVRYQWFSDRCSCHNFCFRATSCSLKLFLITCHIGFCKLSIICRIC